jgi:hypothetical protein
MQGLLAIFGVCLGILLGYVVGLFTMKRGLVSIVFWFETGLKIRVSGVQFPP